MKNHIILLLIWFSLIISNCDTQAPLTPETKKPGQIYVTANLLNSKIYLDSEFTGKHTPDTLTLSPGKYQISVEKNGTFSDPKIISLNSNEFKEANFIFNQSLVKKIVLVEDFANVSCNPCVQSNKILHEISNEYSSDELVVIKFAANFPSNTDPFYLEAKEECDARLSFYNVMFAPTVIIDGILKPISSSKSDIIEKYSDRKNIKPAFNIYAKDTLSGNTLNINIDVTDSGYQDDLTKLKIHTVIVEEKIEFTNAPGSNGETIFYHIVRDMLPDHNGSDLIFSDNEMNLQLNTIINSDYNQNQIRSIVFIQNIETKEIINATIAN